VLCSHRSNFPGPPTVHGGESFLLWTDPLGRASFVRSRVIASEILPTNFFPSASFLAWILPVHTTLDGQPPFLVRVPPLIFFRVSPVLKPERPCPHCGVSCSLRQTSRCWQGSAPLTGRVKVAIFVLGFYLIFPVPPQGFSTPNLCFFFGPSSPPFLDEILSLHRF